MYVCGFRLGESVLGRVQGTLLYIKILCIVHDVISAGFFL